MEFLICSHDKAAANQLGEIISGKYPSCGISYLTTSDLSNKVNTSRADVVFIDGDSDKKNAAVFGSYIQRKNPEARIIFITEDLSFVSNLFFKISPFGIVDKPVSTKKVFGYIDAVRKQKEAPPNKFVYMEKGRTKKLMFSNILFVESRREKLIVNTINSSIVIWTKMSDIEQKFPSFFVRCHKSYLVNMHYITEQKGNVFKLITGDEVAISRSRKEEACTKFFTFKEKEQ